MFNTVEELVVWIESQKRLTPKVSLERFRKICEVYGSPEKNIKYVHVGGTNGKGSTVSFVKSILRKSGYNVGAYISPYVISFNERIEYNEEYISNEDLLEIGNYVISKYDLLEQLGLTKPSFFEVVTLIAFIYFSRLKDLDIVVCEVGLGGLLDATNIITPLVSVISNVAFDHMNVLGNTIQEIAYNKLGIVKEGIPLVTLKNDEILDQIINTTKEKHSDLILVDKKEIMNIDVTFEHTRFDYKEFKGVTSKLLGYHQCENASLALETVKILRDYYHYQISLDNIYDGIYHTFWPGRLQIIHKDPIIIVDGAHNIDGITRLTEFLRFVKKDKYLKIIFAVSADKAKEEMIPVIESVADEIIFSKFNYKRSDKADNLIELSHHLNKRVEEDLDKIIREVKTEKDKLIVFCGSLYFVSEVFKKF